VICGAALAVIACLRLRRRFDRSDRVAWTSFCSSALRALIDGPPIVWCMGREMMR